MRMGTPCVVAGQGRRGWQLGCASQPGHAWAAVELASYIVGTQSYCEPHPANPRSPLGADKNPVPFLRPKAGAKFAADLFNAAGAAARELSRQPQQLRCVAGFPLCSAAGLEGWLASFNRRVFPVPR